MLVAAGGRLGAGPVVVPFGAAWHDWAALELGAWVARATDAPLRLIGAAADDREDGRDASRLLADASLIVQRRPASSRSRCWRAPGAAAIIALAEGAGLLVVGLPERWREEGLGAVRAPARRGAAGADRCWCGEGRGRAAGAGGVADAFGWSLTRARR